MADYPLLQLVLQNPSLLQNTAFLLSFLELEKKKEETKQLQEKTKQMQVKIKQLQLKAGSNSFDYLSTSGSDFYSTLVVTKVNNPDWLTKIPQTITTKKLTQRFKDEVDLQRTLMKFFQKICEGSTLSAYDVRDNPTLDDKKPDVVLVPSQFSLEPPPHKIIANKLSWDDLCNAGGLEHLIQSVIEIKELDEGFTPSHKGQTFGYLHQILQIHQLKGEVVGALTNGTFIMFLKVTRQQENTFENFESEPIPFIDFKQTDHSSEGLQYLIDMIQQGITIDIPLPSSKVALKSYLGRGATSVVYRTSDGNALKLCTSDSFDSNFKVERKRLKYLHKNLPPDLKKHIPLVKRYDDSFLEFELYEKVDMDSFTQLKIKFEKFLPIVNLLKEVHKLEICHRDIKPSNLLLTKNGELVLVDWGYSGNINYVPDIFIGTTLFCASEYGKNRLSQPMSPYLPKYDVESLFKTILYFQNETIRKALQKIRFYQFKEKVLESDKIWSRYQDLYPTAWTFDALKEKLKEFDSLEELSDDEEIITYMNDE